MNYTLNMLRSIIYPGAPEQVFTWEFCEIFQNSFIAKQLQVTAPGPWVETTSILAINIRVPIMFDGRN